MSLGRININALNVYSGNVLFDEIRIGDTWADVSPVPEPSVFGLLGLGALAAAAYRRNRKR